MNTTAIVERADFGQLFEALQERGFATVGPTVRNQTIVCDRIASVDDLPIGWTDIQEAGTYRLVKRDDEAVFGYVVGPHSFKKYLFPLRRSLFVLEKKPTESA